MNTVTGLVPESGNGLRRRRSVSRFESEPDLLPEHERSSEQEANFYPVDGIRGHCKCGNYLHYRSTEGEWECDECGRVWNLFVDHELWEEP